MEPNNFEKNITKKFNSRTIEPSPAAWDRLDAMLTTAEAKKQPINKFWFGIAASLFFVVGLTWFFTKQNNNTNLSLPSQNGTIVTVDTVKNASSKSEINKENNSENKNSTQNKTQPQQFLSPREKTVKQIISGGKKFKTSGLAAVGSSNEVIIVKPLIEIPITIPANSLKTNTLESQNTLAQNTQPETYKYKRKPTIISPNDLLETADKELSQQTFKEKAWKRIQKASSAFASRNYE